MAKSARTFAKKKTTAVPLNSDIGAARASAGAAPAFLALPVAEVPTPSTVTAAEKKKSSAPTPRVVPFNSHGIVYIGVSIIIAFYIIQKNSSRLIPYSLSPLLPSLPLSIFRMVFTRNNFVAT
jgi:hypothetical protein